MKLISIIVPARRLKEEHRQQAVVLIMANANSRSNSARARESIKITIILPNKLTKERVGNNHSLKVVRIPFLTALHKQLTSSSNNSYSSTSLQDSNKTKETAKISIIKVLMTNLSILLWRHYSLSNNWSIETSSISSRKIPRPLPLRVSSKNKGITRSTSRSMAKSIVRGVQRALQPTTFKKALLSYLQRMQDSNRPIIQTIAIELSPVNVREGQWWISNNQAVVSGHKIIRTRRPSSRLCSRRHRDTPWLRFVSITNTEMTTLLAHPPMLSIMIHHSRVSIHLENN